MISSFVRKYIDVLETNKIDYKFLDSSRIDFWEDIQKIDVFIFRYAHYDWDKQIADSIMPVIENEYGIKCFPNHDTRWHFDDKIRQYYLLKAHSFPMAESWIFYDKQLAMDWLKDAQYPIVFKLRIGAGSSNVLLVKNQSHARRLVKIMFGKGIDPNNFTLAGSTFQKDFNVYKYSRKVVKRILQKLKKQPQDTFWKQEKNYVLFQKFLPNNDFDTRVTIIGNRAFAFRRFNRDNDFRSSGSGKINYDMKEINPEFIKLGFGISKKLNFQSMAYDFLYDEEKDVSFCEISYTYQSGAVHDCPGYWDDNLNWHEGHYWPQYCQLIDLLERPDLVQPEH